MPVRAFAWSLPLLLAGIPVAFCQQIGNPAAGKRLADTSCVQCHDAAKAPPAAPEFGTIAAMPSTTGESLGVFLRTSHPSMPNIILSSAERDDVIAYILSLRP